LKQLQTHFKAKQEKGVGTPFPRVPAVYPFQSLPFESFTLSPFEKMLPFNCEPWGSLSAEI